MNNANCRMGGKVVLVTGGTSGIGKAAATALAAIGAKVVVTGRNREKGEKAVVLWLREKTLTVEHGGEPLSRDSSGSSRSVKAGG